MAQVDPPPVALDGRDVEVEVDVPGGWVEVVVDVARGAEVEVEVDVPGGWVEVVVLVRAGWVDVVVPGGWVEVVVEVARGAEVEVEVEAEVDVDVLGGSVEVVDAGGGVVTVVVVGGRRDGLVGAELDTDCEVVVSAGAVVEVPAPAIDGDVTSIEVVGPAGEDQAEDEPDEDPLDVGPDPPSEPGASSEPPALPPPGDAALSSDTRATAPDAIDPATDDRPTGSSTYVWGFGGVGTGLATRAVISAAATAVAAMATRRRRRLIRWLGSSATAVPAAGAVGMAVTYVNLVQASPSQYRRPSPVGFGCQPGAWPPCVW